MTCAEDVNLCMNEGRDLTITINNYSDEDKQVPLDITGYTFYFTAKKKIGDKDANAVLSKDVTTHVNPTGGVTAIIFAPSDTVNKSGEYVYDIVREDTSAGKVQISKGTFTVEQAVTDR